MARPHTHLVNHEIYQFEFLVCMNIILSLAQSREQRMSETSARPKTDYQKIFMIKFFFFFFFFLNQPDHFKTGGYGHILLKTHHIGWFSIQSDFGLL